jgi:DNA-binding CsgD family transcriptional regulator
MPLMVGRISSPTFVGRNEELSVLRTAAERTSERTAMTVVVGGEAGVGKTRLVDTLVSEMRAGGARVLRGACLEVGDGGLPFAPFVEALRELWHDSDPAELGAILGPARNELARLVPELAEADAPDWSGPMSASSTGRLFELVLGVVERLSDRAPAMLVLEDLHWSDTATRDLLMFLVRNVRQQRLLIVATYRSDALHRLHPLHPLLAELGRLDRVERLVLGRFDRDEVNGQLTGILGHAPDRRLLDSVVDRSGGNAFHVEELVALGATGGALSAPLRDLMLARVASISEPTQVVLRAAATIGRGFDERTLARVTGLAEAALFEALREAVGAHLVEPLEESTRADYRFRHALVHEAIYADQLPGERARLHAACALVLSEGEGGRAGVPIAAAPAAEIAHHWSVAQDQPRALAATVAAGRAALDVYAFGDAQGQFESALALWDRVDAPDSVAGIDRLELLRHASDSAWLAGDGRRAVILIRSAIELVDPKADPATVALLQERLGQYLWDAGDEAGAGTAYETAAALQPTDPPTESHARILAAQAQMLMLGGRYEESISVCREALVVAAAVGSTAVESHARCTLGVDLGGTGRFDEGVAELQAARLLAERPPRPDDLARAWLNLGIVLWQAGQLAESTRVSLEGVEVARRLGMDRTFGRSMVTNAAITTYYEGRWDEASRLVDEALDGAAEGLVRIHLLLTRVQLAIGRGERAVAKEGLAEVGALVEPVIHAQLIGDLQALAAEHALWRGDLDVARSAVADGLERLGQTEDAILRARLCSLGIRAEADRVELARVRRAERDVASAIETADALLAIAEASGSTEAGPDGAAGQSFLGRVPAAWLALSRAERGRASGASDPDSWRRAADAWSALGVPYPAAYASWREAEARLAIRSGSREEIAVVLRAARDTAAALGARPLLTEVEQLATRARIELNVEEDVTALGEPLRPEVAQLGLTTRELEVLGLIAAGRTNRQIAEALFITEKTAGAHVSNILGKLGVAGRVEAARIALRLGLEFGPEAVSEP